jgi:hypothetical protein
MELVSSILDSVSAFIIRGFRVSNNVYLGQMPHQTVMKEIETVFELLVTNSIFVCPVVRKDVLTW